MKTHALISIALGYKQLGDEAKGREMPQKSLDSISASFKEGEEYEYNYAWSSIALAYLNLGDAVRAKTMATEFAKKYNPDRFSSDTNQNFGVLQAELGNWGMALHFSKNCHNGGKLEILTKILRVHAEQKHPEFKALRNETRRGMKNEDFQAGR